MKLQSPDLPADFTDYADVFLSVLSVLSVVHSPSYRRCDAKGRPRLGFGVGLLWHDAGSDAVARESRTLRSSELPGALSVRESVFIRYLPLRSAPGFPGSH